MAASVVQAKLSSWLGAATSRGQSFTGDPVAGNVLFCAVYLGTTGITPTVTDTASGSNVWTLDKLINTSGGGSLAIFRLSTVAVLPTSATTIQGNFTSSVQAIGIIEASGVTNGAPEKTSSNTGTSSAPSAGALGVLAATGDLVIGLFLEASAQTFTVGTDGQGNTMNSLYTSTNGQAHTAGGEYLVESGTLSYNPAATFGGSAAWSALAVAYPASTAAPTNSVAPAVTGTARRGQVLTTTDGTWTGSPSFTYQWKRDGSNIAAATSNTYTQVAADVGHIIKCTVTATNGSGSLAVDSNSTLAVSQARTAVIGNARIEFCANDMVATRNVGALPGITYPLVPDGSPFLLLNP